MLTQRFEVLRSRLYCDGGYGRLITQLQACTDVKSVNDFVVAYSILNRVDSNVIAWIAAADVAELCEMIDLKYVFYIETGLIIRAMCPEWFWRYMKPGVYRELEVLFSRPETYIDVEGAVLEIRRRLYFPVSLASELLRLI